MNPEEDDADEELVDDLIQFEGDANRLENIRFLDPGIIDLSWDSDRDDNSVKQAAHPHSDRKPVTNSTITPSGTVKQLFIKLVDCFKFPTYFDQQTKDIIEKTHKLQIPTEMITYVDVGSNERPTETGVNVSDETDLKLTRDGTKRLEAYKRRNDMEVKKAMNELNKTKVDLKKNKGLVGMKILRMPQKNISKMTIKQTKINENISSHQIVDHLNVETINKLLNKTGISCTPVVLKTPESKNKIGLRQDLVHATKAETTIDPTTCISFATKLDPVTIEIVSKQNDLKQMSDKKNNQEKYDKLSEPLNVRAVAEEIYRNIAVQFARKNIKSVNKPYKPMPKSKNIGSITKKPIENAQSSLKPMPSLPILKKTDSLNKQVNSEQQINLKESKAKDLTFLNITSLGRPEKDSTALTSNKAMKTDFVSITSEIKPKSHNVQADPNIVNKFTKNVLTIAKQNKKIKISAIDNLHTKLQQMSTVARSKGDIVSASSTKQSNEESRRESKDTSIPELSVSQPCHSNKHHKERKETAIVKRDKSTAEFAMLENTVNTNKTKMKSKAPRKQTIKIVSGSERNVKDYMKYNKNTNNEKIPTETNAGHNIFNHSGSTVDTKAHNPIHIHNLSSPPYSRPNCMPKCQTPVKDNPLTVYNSMQCHTLYKPPSPNVQLSPRVSPNILRNIQYPAPNQETHPVCLTLDSPHIDRHSWATSHSSSNRSQIIIESKTVNLQHKPPVISIANPTRGHRDIPMRDVNGSHDVRATHQTTVYMKPGGFNNASIGYPQMGFNGESMPLEVNKLCSPSQINGNSHSFVNENPLLESKITQDATRNAPPQIANAQNSLPLLEVCKVGSKMVFWSPVIPPPKLPHLSIPSPVIPQNPRNTHNTSIIGKNKNGVIRAITLTTPKLDRNNIEISKATDNSNTQSNNGESGKHSFQKPNDPKSTDKVTMFTNSSLTYSDSKGSTDGFENNCRSQKKSSETISYKPVSNQVNNIAVNDKDGGMIQTSNNKIEQKIVQLFGDDSNPDIGLERTNNPDPTDNEGEPPEKQNAGPANLKRPSDGVHKKPTMYKPGPLSKKKKFDHPNDVKITERKLSNNGYSDPILPILTFSEFLSMPFPYKFFDTFNKVDENTDEAKSDNQTNKAKQLNLKNNKNSKRRLTLDDYKKRTATIRKHLEEDQASTEQQGQKKANDIARRTSYADSDLGYDSDNTVKL